MAFLRLVRADVLKLRRRRGMLSIAILGTLGAMALGFGVAAIQHASNPEKYGPAGGLESYHGALQVLILLVLVAGSIVGATSGTQDIESGVFRDLAATGRSRMALFGSRVAGALAVSLPIAALAAAGAGVGAVALAGSLDAPSAGALLAGTAGVLVAAALSTAVAVGVSALVGSRGPVIGILLAFFLAIEPLIQQFAFLGSVRELFPAAALNRLGDLPAVAGVHAALGTAIAVTLAWAAVAMGAGAWRTRTREI